MKIIKPYQKKERLLKKFNNPSKAKQQFKKECDINNILNKHQRTGILTHVNQHAPQYGEIPVHTFHEAMNIVKDAQNMFNELPSTIRQNFGNSPEAFLEYVENPENIAELRKLGLAKPSTAPIPDLPTAPVVESPPKTPKDVKNTAQADS